VGLALHVEKSWARASKAARPLGDSSISFSRMHLAKISFVECESYLENLPQSRCLNCRAPRGFGGAHTKE
jgi:hypothetical protein